MMQDSGPQQAEEPLLRMRDYQNALVALSRAASESLAPERLMHHVTAQVSRATQVSRVKIMRYRADRGDLLVVAGVGWNAGVVGQTTLSIDTASPPGRTMQTAGPVTIEDLPNDSEFRQSEVLRQHGIVSLLNVPIMVDSRTWGVLEIDSESHRQFDSSDTAFLTTAANILGVALLHFEIQQKEAEAAAKHLQDQRRAEMLYRELQHRVKNNLQTIIAFLSLQRRRAESTETRDKLLSVMHRVQAISLAHDQLALDGHAGQVDLGDYLRALCANIDPRRDGIIIEVEVLGRLRLSLDRAVPVGLIVNELVTNSLKYAFDDGVPGAVRVAFSTDTDLGEALLLVEDNGRGMQQPRKGAAGLALIGAFAQQLGGRVDREPILKGTRTTVRFPQPT